MNGNLTTLPNLSGTISAVGGLSGTLSAGRGGAPDIYDGAYEVTPGEEDVVLQTNGFLMTDNVTVEKIPSNYGRIAWNGSVITVY